MVLWNFCFDVIINSIFDLSTCLLSIADEFHLNLWYTQRVPLIPYPSFVTVRSYELGYL